MAAAAWRWPEGGWLDTVDKDLSRPAFHCELPAALEIALTGSFMPCCGPVYAMLVVPAVLVAMAPQSKAFRCFAVGPIIAVGLGAWVQLCLASIAGGGGGVHQAYMHEHPASGPLIILLPYVTLALAGLGGAAGKKAAGLYLCSWFVTQSTNGFLKLAVGRARPLAALAAELGAVHRSIPIVEQARPSQIYLSFPSGDAAASANFATALLLSAPRRRAAAAGGAFTLLASFGRLYFHSHHALDVAVGLAIGVAVTVLLGRCCGKPGWRHLAATQAVILAMISAAPKQ